MRTALKFAIMVAAITVIGGLVHKTLVQRPIQRTPVTSAASGPSPVRNETPAGTREPSLLPVAGVPPASWKSIESRDPQKLIANLRDIGCPEQTIRDLMTFRVCRQYRKKLLELEMSYLIPLGYT